MVGDSGFAYGSGLVMGSHSRNYILGKILTIIDSVGLQERQEKAIKDLISQAMFSEDNNVVWINSELHTKIREADKRERSEATKNKTPMNELGVEDIK